MSELVWVSVPAGAVTDGKAIVQVVIVPRLDEAGLPELGNWAGRVLEPTFQPEVLVNGQTVSAELVGTSRPDVWEAFFPPGTTVLPWQPPAGRTADAIVVRPSSAEEQDLTMAYADAATDIDNPAHVNGVITGFRGDRRTPSPRRTRPVAEDRPPADFHEIVAGLRDQPAVLRSLGLILDLRINIPAPGGGEVRVRWPGGNLPVRSPLTAYTVESGHFLPAALDPSQSWPRIAGGMVDVRPVAGWRLSTIDIDQGVASLGAAQASGRTDAMPAPRTSGISLLREERSADLLAEAGRSQARGADLDDEVLGIADLVLGYRVDARIRGRSWFPLGARRATHTVNGIDIVREALEDAHIKPFALTREDDQLSTDEVVSRWTGWGLGTLRPHERATVVDMPSQAALRQPTRQPQAFDHRWEFTEPGDQRQLPLRFGQTYEMRVRVADLAGGGLSLDDPVDSLGTDPVVFLRHEPVPPPNLVTPDGLLGPGGALDTLVVRSDRDVSAAAFAAAHPQYPDNAHRRLRPPDTTLTLAEHHGRLDGPMEEAEPVFRRGLGLDGAPPLPDPMSHGVVFHLAGTAEGSSVVWPGDWPDLGEVPVTLEPLPPGDVLAAATDHDGTVLVRLPQGEAVDLEVRSMLQRTDQAYFQLSRWLDARRDPGLVNSPDLAMHSLAAPPSRLRLIHAIRRPLRDPSGNMRVTRVKDSTSVELTPTEPWFGLHRPSTAQVLVTASWHEWGDDDKAEETADEATLPPLTVPLDDGTDARLVLDFRDTRRRDVSHDLTAVSRYRSYFHEGDLEADFAAPASFPAVVVPNSGMPPPIRILSVVPAFQWEGPTSLAGDGDLTLLRRGGRVRVELDHPWYATGAGELLGVVLDPPGSPAGTLTELARDPVWRTGAPQLSMDGHQPATVDHPESPLDVQVLGFPVFLVDGRWYADLVLPVTTYAPLVRLALARYQPESVDGRHLSALSRTDFVPLLPDRTLNLRRTADRLSVRLTGADPGPGREPLVTAAVERRPAGSANHFTAVERDEPSAWSRVGTESSGRLDAELAVTLPAAEGDELRLVVTEAERYDGPEPTSTLDQTLTHRTTYLAHITLDGTG